MEQNESRARKWTPGRTQDSTRSPGSKDVDTAEFSDVLLPRAFWRR